jgi:hypothetical protein
MGKRLVRINTLVGFNSLIPGSEVQSISQSGVTIPGLLLKVEEKLICIKDSGGKIHCIQLSDIREVIIDKVAPY